MNMAYDYNDQIRLAQDFLDENPQADISRLQCLMRKILPSEYHFQVDLIRRTPAVAPTINVMGGHNLIAPQASTATQNVASAPESHKDAAVLRKLQVIEDIVTKHHNYTWAVSQLLSLGPEDSEVNCLLDRYVTELTEKEVMTLIQIPHTEIQTFALLHAALTLDENSLVCHLLSSPFVRNCKDSRYKHLVCAAIERARRCFPSRLNK